MPLLHLSNELLFEVTKYLRLRDKYALLQTNHFFAALLAPVLVKTMFSKDTDRHCITALYLAAASGFREAIILGSPPLGEVIGFEVGKVIWVDELEGDISVDEYVDFFLEEGSSSTIREIWNGMTALHLAVECPSLKIAKLLVEEGINVDKKDFNNATALYMAACEGSHSIAKLLLQGGARVDAQDFGNYSPLHIAVVDGDRLLLELFLEYGADISLQDGVGRNALFYAVRGRDQDMASILLAHGTDIDIYNPDCYLHQMVSLLLSDSNEDTVLDLEGLLVRYGKEDVASPVNLHLRDLEG